MVAVKKKNRRRAVDRDMTGILHKYYMPICEGKADPLYETLELELRIMTTCAGMGCFSYTVH